MSLFTSFQIEADGVNNTAARANESHDGHDTINVLRQAGKNPMGEIAHHSGNDHESSHHSGDNKFSHNNPLA
jgi:hypothetical protein